MKIEFTDSQYVRSHGHSPRGRGRWAFQPTTGYEAYDRQMINEPEFWATGTLTEAKRKARAHYAEQDLAADVAIAILP